MESQPLEFFEHLQALKPFENFINIPRAAVRYLVSTVLLFTDFIHLLRNSKDGSLSEVKISVVFLELMKNIRNKGSE